MSDRIRVVHLTEAPIPHLVPLYRLVARDPRIDLTVLFASSGGIRPVEIGHGQPTRWDTDLLSGYRSKFLSRADINPVDGGFETRFWTFRDIDVVSKMLAERCEVLWLFGYSYLTHMMAACTQLLRARPVLFRTDQTLLPGFRPLWKQAVKGLVLPVLLRRCYGLYVGSESKKWMEYYGARTNRMYFTPYCTDDSELPILRDLSERSRLKARAILGVPQYSGPIVLMVARLVDKKNPLLLLRAFQRVRSEQPCVLMFVGSGHLEQQLRSYVADWRIPDVVFKGFMSRRELAVVYAAADIFALTSSYRETWGTVVNEAMGFGLPIVLTDQVGCAADLVVDGTNGYVVSSGDTNALVGRLSQLISDRALRERLGKRSANAIQLWNHSVAARGVLQAIADAVGPKRWAKSQGALGDSLKSDAT